MAAIGTLSVLKSPNSRYYPCALLGICFAIQQFAEGFLWLLLPGQSITITFLQYTFLFFALVAYPIMFPLAVYLIEQVKERRRIICFLLCVGLLTAAYNALMLILVPSEAHIVNHSIQYYPEKAPWFFKAIYLGVLTGPMLVSSVKYFPAVGIVSIITFFISLQFYYETMTSVWCFMAAVVCMSIYLIIKQK